MVAVPWIEPSSVYSHIAVQVPADSDVYFSDGVVCVVGMVFVSHITLHFVCLTAYVSSVMALLVMLRVLMVKLCCLLSLGSYSWLKFDYRLH